MFQVITEEEYSDFKKTNRGQAIYFVPDDKIVVANVPDHIRSELLDYAREHQEYWSDDEYCYVIDFEWRTAIMLTKVKLPFLIFIAVLSPDKPKSTPQE